jgi:hypothetical protein
MHEKFRLGCSHCTFLKLLANMLARNAVSPREDTASQASSWLILSRKQLFVRSIASWGKDYVFVVWQAVTFITRAHGTDLPPVFLS